MTLVTAVQLYRGNFGSAWVSHGGYKLVAEVLLNNSHPQPMAMSYPKMTDGGSS
jgi:hypothetical protein